MITLQANGTLDCEVTLVGLFHRDAANLRFVADVISASRPEAIALEARPSFVPAYRALTAALPKSLVRKLEAAPLRDLQETLTYVSLEDRLSWHAALLSANERLAAASSFAPTASSSALSPPRLLSAFLARELALSDKVAAVCAAGAAGLPLHGLELDDPASYSALLSGPLTQGGRGAFGGGGAAAAATAAANGCGPGGGLSPEALEAEQRRIALSCLPPTAAEAFERWFRRVPRGAAGGEGEGEDGDDGEVLRLQLAALMAQCMDPASYLSYVDETDALMSDARRVGAAAAAQYAQLTGLREAHFLRRLRQLAAGGDGGGDGGGNGGGRRPRRLAVVLGRAHAARLRRALRAEAGARAAAR